MMVFVERPSAMMVGSWELNKLHQKNGRANHENCETGGFNHHTCVSFGLQPTPKGDICGIGDK